MLRLSCIIRTINTDTIIQPLWLLDKLINCKRNRILAFIIALQGVGNKSPVNKSQLLVESNLLPSNIGMTLHFTQSVTFFDTIKEISCYKSTYFQPPCSTWIRWRLSQVGWQRWHSQQHSQLSLKIKQRHFSWVSQFCLFFF